MTKKKVVDPKFEALVSEDFTRIPRAFFWAYTWASRHLLRYEDAVFKAIIANTWGWNRMEARTAITLISRMTGIMPKHIPKALDMLIRNRMVIKKKDKYGNNVLSIQYDHNEWRMSTKYGNVDFSKMKTLKVYPTDAEKAEYREMDRCDEANEI